MAEVKDKIVTVESLSALHEHNKETYMAKVDPTGTGSFSMNDSVASGQYSHAEGKSTMAEGDASHAEGYGTRAEGDYSHAEGISTIASSSYQHVQGKFNILDDEDRYAHIVGNGYNGNDRSNAHTVNWHGDGWFAGDVYVGGSSEDDAIRLVKSANIVSVEYGDTLPEAGTVGRIFFKRLSE